MYFGDNLEWLRDRRESLKEKLKALRAANPRDTKIEALETKIWEREKAAREAQAKANAIDTAVFDLKAVNPTVVVKIDTRTPDQVIQSSTIRARLWRKPWRRSDSS